MKMRWLITTALVAMTGGAFFAQVPVEPAKSGAPGTLDLIPENAVVAGVIRSPEELGKKGDQLFKELDFDPVPGETPSSGIDKAVDFLIGNLVGVRQGLDLRGSLAGAVLPGPDGKDSSLDAIFTNFVLSLPIKDRDQMAANFGFAEGELPEGAVRAVKTADKERIIKFVALRGGHVLLSQKEEILQQALPSRRLGGRLAADQRASFGTADVLVYFNPRAATKEFTDFRKSLEGDKDLDQWLADPEEKKTVQRLLKTLDHLKFILVGVRLDKGVGWQLHVALDDQAAEVKEFLVALKGKGHAHLNGLPADRLVASHALGGREGSSPTNAAQPQTPASPPRSPQDLLARAFADFFLKNALETGKLTSAADRPTLLGVFGAVWDRLHGHRLGVYLTKDEARLGLFSVVAILDTADAQEFLAEMRTLAKIGDGTLDLTKPEARQEVDLPRLVRDLGSDRYSIRASATTKLRLIGEPALSELEKVAAKGDLETVRRVEQLIAQISAVAAARRKELLQKDVPKFIHPTFTWVAQAETRLGQSVDIIHIMLKDADPSAAKMMQEYFGPDWDKMRLAVCGQQVVVLLGSDVESFDQALKSLQDGATASTGSNPNPSGRPVAQFQASTHALSSLVSGAPRRLPGPQLTSLTLSVSASGLQIDVHVPTEDLRALINPKRR